MEKELKAAEALEREQRNSFNQYKALGYSLKAKMMMQETNLPYKVLFDLVKADMESEKEDFEREILPNKFYPNSWDDYEKISSLSPIDLFHNGNMKDRRDPEFIKRREKYFEEVKKLETPEDKWEYYNARFIVPYDFDIFENYDWFGKEITQEEEQGVKEYFKGLQKRCKDHPEDFFLEPNTKNKHK